MNKRISIGFILVTLSGLLGSGSLFAQQIAPARPADVVVSLGELNEPDVHAPDIIFSNLDRTLGARYNTDGAFTLAGKQAGDNQTESWYALAFTPREDVLAKGLAAPITYVSGDRLVVLGIYTDDDGTVGELLPGGEGSTAQIPDKGECCQLTKVLLPGEGVALTAGTRYWLVAAPDNANGPTFHGQWYASNRAKSAYLQPPRPWNPQEGS